MEEKKEESPKSVIDMAKELYAQIKAENDRREEILRKEQQLEADRLLGSSAGRHIETPPISQEDLKKKQAIEFWKGTSFAEAIEKHNG
jgi:predicted transcriptional regulator